jgi:hypothetical protein
MYFKENLIFFAFFIVFMKIIYILTNEFSCDTMKIYGRRADELK